MTLCHVLSSGNYYKKISNDVIALLLTRVSGHSAEQLVDLLAGENMGTTGKNDSADFLMKPLRYCP